MRDRAYRRWRYRQRKERVRRLAEWYYRGRTEWIDDRWIGHKADTSQICGCRLCRDPEIGPHRKSRVVPTWQERRADRAEQEQVGEERHLPCNPERESRRNREVERKPPRTVWCWGGFDEHDGFKAFEELKILQYKPEWQARLEDAGYLEMWGRNISRLGYTPDC